MPSQIALLDKNDREAAALTDVAGRRAAMFDAINRAEGLRAMAPIIIRYESPRCPHEGCGHEMEWIAFNLETYGDRPGIREPLVRAWWEGRGFAGRCPACQGWIRFRTLEMDAIGEGAARRMERLPDDWHTVARFVSSRSRADRDRPTRDVGESAPDWLPHPGRTDQVEPATAGPRVDAACSRPPRTAIPATADRSRVGFHQSEAQ